MSFPYPPNLTATPVRTSLALAPGCTGLSCQGVPEISFLDSLTILPTHVYLPLGPQLGIGSRDQALLSIFNVIRLWNHHSGNSRVIFPFSSLPSGFWNPSKLWRIKQICLRPFSVGGRAEALISLFNFWEGCSKTFILIPLMSALNK